MDQPDDVTFFLDDGLLKSARAGQHNFIRLVSEVLTEAGLTPHYVKNTALARTLSDQNPGYSLFHMDDPTHDRALTLRRAYYYPFWQIEASARRWEWDVALSDFDPSRVDRDAADKFFKFWRRRLFKGMPDRAWRDPYIYVPLQGLIRKHRSFQACSPIEMLTQVAERYPDRPIHVTLHPGEQYTSADRMALAQVIGTHPRVEIVQKPMEKCLIGCDFVVTQNSSVAFAGYFFRKPAVLFGQVDFHHIAGSVMRDGTDAAFDVVGSEPDYAGYVWWFLQVMAINAGKDTAKDQIATVLRGHGWPI